MNAARRGDDRDIAYPDELIGSRAIIQGASGAGKTFAIRRILEETHGLMQHLILDVEDEMFTLREKFDYVLIGGDDADAPITVETAAQMAVALLELKVSAILQLNDVGLTAQRNIIAAFITGLMGAPRSLWHPVLVTLDEAHRYAPQSGTVASSEPLTNLATAGRKRPFGALFATQRLSMLSKDILGQCPNRIIGRVDQSLDRQKAADLLGFSPSSEEGRGLMRLNHEFWVVGPAFSAEPKLHKFAKPMTTHLEPGKGKVPTPATPEKVRAMLGKLAKLATKPADDATRPAPVATKGPKHATADAPITVPVDVEAIKRAAFEAGRRSAAADADAARTEGYKEAIADAQSAVVDLAPEAAVPRQGTSGPKHRAVDIETVEAAIREPVSPKPKKTRAPGEIGAAAKDLLETARKRWPCRFNWQQLAALCQRKAVGGSFNEARKELLDGGHVSEIDGKVVPAGMKAAKDLPPEELIAIWTTSLTTAAAKLFTGLHERWPLRLTWAQLAMLCGMKATGGSYNAARRLLLDMELVREEGDKVVPAFSAKASPRSREEIMEMWTAVLPAPADQLLRTIAKVKAGLSAEELAQRTGRVPQGGSWNGAIALLRDNGLIVEQGKRHYVLGDLEGGA